MLTQTQLTQTLNQLKTLSEQNTTDLLYLESSYPLTQPLTQYLHDKMQVLQDLINIATSALCCVQDLKEERDGLESSCEAMRGDLGRLCEVNLELEERVELLMKEIGEQREELGLVSRKQQILELQKSIIRKELQSTKSQLQKIEQLQSLPLTSNITNSLSLKKQPSVQPQSKNRSQKQDITNFRKEFNQLRDTTHILKKKASQQSYKENQIKSLNSLSFLSSNLPKMRLIKKLSQESLQSISMSSKKMKDSGRDVTPVRLADQLKNLNLTSCNSIYELTPVPSEENPANQTNETEQNQSICLTYKYEQIPNPKDSTKRFKKSSPLAPSPLKKIDKATSITSEEEKTCCKIMHGLEEIHRFCFNKIVRDRIQPRRMIRRRRALAAAGKAV